MDFSKVLEALDHLIVSRIQAAAYTRMVSAIVVGIENSENNIYKVTRDNGKTIILAVAIAPTTDIVQYQKGDSVQLLELNGVDNTNTVLYILGKSEDIKEQELADLNDYFTEMTSVKINNLGDAGIIYNSDSDIVKNLKLYGSFIIKGTFTASSNVNNKTPEYYNYGLKITLTFNNNIESIIYNFDTLQMVGQPWLYNSVIQEFKKTIDEYKLFYLKSIKIEKICDIEKTFEVSNLSIASALLNVFNDYTAELKGVVKGVDFISAQQADKITTTLQTKVYKNNQTFASSNCEYYWFIRDDNITAASNEYCFYGGIGWKCLNAIEIINYIDNTSEKIFKNNIGEILTISSDNAPAYHNYYKCVVKYGLHLAETDKKEILNLNKTNLTFQLTANNTVITNSNKELILTLTYSPTDEVSSIKWKYRKDKETQEYDCTPENVSTELKIDKDTLKDQLGENYTTYSCILIHESVTVGAPSIVITRDFSSEKVEEVWYYNNGNSISPPEKPDSTPGGGWTRSLKGIDVDNSYIFAVSRMVSYGDDTTDKYVYIGPFGDVYCYSAHGTGAAAAQLTEFNRLTRNGEDQGLFYGTYQKTSDSSPQQGKIYYEWIEGKYELFNGTAFESNKDYYERTGNDLYINASYINTGALRVGNSGSEKFFASINSNIVKIGGFTADTNFLKEENDRVGMSTGYGDSEQKWVFWAKNTETALDAAPFRVDTSGKLYATSGEIGGFTVGTNKIYSIDNKIGLSSNNANSDNVAFWAGNNDIGSVNKPGFYVTYDGNVYCNKVFVAKNEEGSTIFEIRDGAVNWTANNTPMKYLYSENSDIGSLLDFSYNNFPDSSSTDWHKNYTTNDHWYAVSTSGAQGTFNGPLRLDGEKGANGSSAIANVEGNGQFLTVEEVFSQLDPTISTIVNLKNGGLTGAEGKNLGVGNWSILVMGI